MASLRFVPRRNRRKDPESGSCPIALYRICGVCKHHSGATPRATGDCSWHHLRDVPGTRSAAECNDFERPTVAPKASQPAQERPTRPSSAPTSRHDRLAALPSLAAEGLSIAGAAERIGCGRSTLVRDMASVGHGWAYYQKQGVADV